VAEEAAQADPEIKTKAAMEAVVEHYEAHLRHAVGGVEYSIGSQLLDPLHGCLGHAAASEVQLRQAAQLLRRGGGTVQQGAAVLRRDQCVRNAVLAHQVHEVLGGEGFAADDPGTSVHRAEDGGPQPSDPVQTGRNEDGVVGINKAVKDNNKFDKFLNI